MLTSSQPLKDVFFCPEESSFYSYCLESLVFRKCLDAESVVEFGSGDGSPVIQSLLRTEFEGTVQGFEVNRLACQVAKSKIKENKLSDRYIIHNRSLFNSPRPYATYLVSNPPYLPAEDNKIYQPFLHGGIDGITVTKQLLSLDYQNVLVLVASYSNPEGLIRYALANDYCVSDFTVSPMPFGYYSSEPKVKDRIQALRREKRAFYSQNLYLLAGVLFSRKSAEVDNLSDELLKLMTCL
ncbi:methyltransferase [Desertifilum sp. FACHB-1129]|uniref:Methyltransferase n=2 Tax=Desertifilum tharense IPPAS B-1220 TaxID=1781255 RepID=A0A1E5QHY1_9CYAN|nr:MULTISPECIES: methyltransferase [Desertifilum]MDA0212368.1 methyltransferase [Cyanobacteria bacterium FC1]MBD2311755.1 methyltransferase [Desertifilum sp. FACHB-1129]MBD2322719.1 methyltransferase [Desertifilum sp. FACHB-866]MBD2332887.1 methyltransferase [Desertifilum sp. FACHB-868]OEJ74204.1 methyltransferase [Desertifilum tharense IPPAS B-1220]